DNRRQDRPNFRDQSAFDPFTIENFRGSRPQGTKRTDGLRRFGRIRLGDHSTQRETTDRRTVEFEGVNEGTEIFSVQSRRVRGTLGTASSSVATEVVDDDSIVGGKRSRPFGPESVGARRAVKTADWRALPARRL